MSLNLFGHEMYPEEDVDIFPDGTLCLQFNIISALDECMRSNIISRLRYDTCLISQIRDENIVVDFDHFEENSTDEEGYVFSITLSNTDRNTARSIYKRLKESYRRSEDSKSNTTDFNTTFTTTHLHLRTKRESPNAQFPQTQDNQESESLIGSTITIQNNGAYTNNINVLFPNTGQISNSRNHNFSNDINQNQNQSTNQGQSRPINTSI
jgi:hypothetical protein